MRGDCCSRPPASPTARCCTGVHFRRRRDRDRDRGDALGHRHGALDQGRAPPARQVPSGLRQLSGATIPRACLWLPFAVLHIHLVGSVPSPMRTRCSIAVSAALGRGCSAIPDGETGERMRLDRSSRAGVRNDQSGLGEIRRGVSLCTDGAGTHVLSSQARQRRPPTCISTTLFYADIAIGPTSRVRRAEGRREDRGALPLPGRSRPGAFGDLALPAGRSAGAGRSDLQRRAACARSTRSPRRSRTISLRSSSMWRRRCSPGCERNEPSTPMAATKSEMQRDASARILVRSCRSRARRTSSCCFISAMAISATSMWSSRPTWATWSIRQPAVRAASTRPIQLIHMPVPRDRSDDAYFAPAEAAQAQAGDAAVPRARALHRRRRRHAPAPRPRRKNLCRIFHRHRMRVRPAAADTIPELLAHPRRGRG